jgi:O-antigen ligase
MTWLLLLFSAASIFNRYLVFSYYGMSICTIPVFQYFKTKKKKYVIHFLICLLPSFILVKRTPLLGIASSVMVFAILMYKWKALVPSILAIALGIFIILNIPSFRAKLFFNTDITSIQDISRNDVENVNMNGRIYFWGLVLDKFYSRSPIFGTGMGTVKAYLQSNQNEYKSTFSLMHNDWLLILCEQGLVGVILLMLFMIGILIKCIKYAANQYPKELRLVSAACAGSVVSTAIHMFFENCMNSFVFSTTFVFYAILKTCIHEYSKNRISR